MNSLEASIRNTKTKGEVNRLRHMGEVPAIIYGGSTFYWNNGQLALQEHNKLYQRQFYINA